MSTLMWTILLFSHVCKWVLRFCALYTLYNYYYKKQLSFIIFFILHSTFSEWVEFNSTMTLLLCVYVNIVYMLCVARTWFRWVCDFCHINENHSSDKLPYTYEVRVYNEANLFGKIIVITNSISYMFAKYIFENRRRWPLNFNCTRIKSKCRLISNS